MPARESQPRRPLVTPSELLAQLEQCRYDLSVTQTRLIDAIRQLEHLLAANEIRTAPPRLQCPECANTYRNQRDLDEHRYRAHDGPVPEHYLQAERLAGIEPA